MPWPFRRETRRRDGLASDATPVAAEPEDRPVTLADLAPRRPVVTVNGVWDALPPIVPSSTAKPPTLTGGPGFLGTIAGARPLLGTSERRRPRSPARAAAPVYARPEPSEPPAVAAAAEPSLPSRAARILTAQPVGTPRRPSYTHVEAEPDRFEVMPGWAREPEAEEPVTVAEVVEELPPPIFSSILAAQTGQDLSELRPDWTGPIPEAPAEPAAPVATTPPQARRRRSLGESRRLGLGPPLPSAGQDRADDLLDNPVELTTSVESAEPVVRPVAPERAPVEPPGAEEPTADAGRPVPEASTPATVWYQTTTTPGASHLERVPVSVRQDVAQAVGLDVGEGNVHRGPEVEEEATRIGVRAFYRDGEVFVPAGAGGLDTPRVRGLVAHELTHLAQLRQHGGNMPARETPAGRRLEAEARAVERYARGDDVAPVLPPRRLLPTSAGEPHVDAGGYLRAVTEHLPPSGPGAGNRWSGPAAGAPQGPVHQTWAAERDEGHADAELQRAVQEDLEAHRRWLVNSRSASGDELARLNVEEQERHVRFMEQYGDRLGRSGGTSGGTGGGEPEDEAAFEPGPVAAHEGFLGMFREQGGVRGLDPGLAGLVGQFGRRTRAERDDIDARIGEHREVAAPLRPEAVGGRTATPAPATAPASAGPSSTAPTGGGRRAGAPAEGGDLEPGAVTAHEGLLGMFREQGGVRGLDPGIAGLVDQFGRRTGAEQDDIAARIRDHREVAGPRTAGESDEAYGLRMAQVHDIQRRSGLRPPQPPSRVPEETPTPATAPTSPSVGVSAPATPPAGTSPAEAPALTGTAEGHDPTAIGPPAAGGGAAAVAASVASRFAPATAAELSAAAPGSAHSGPAPGELAARGAPSDDVLARLDEHDLEELSNMLYGRFRTRLRRELLIDRERTGLLTDFR